MAASITFTGLASGTDWVKIIDQLVKAERYQIDHLDTWKGTWEDKMTSIRGLNARLLSLESFVKTKNTVSEFQATKATSSNEDVLTVTSTSTATPGAHSVTVGSSIKHKAASQGVAGNASVISSRNGTLTVYVGSSHVDVAVTSGMTLSQLQAAIEAADGSNILTAEILDDGSSSNPKRLTLLANTGGSSNLVSVTENPSSLTFADNFINPAVYAAGWSGTSQAASAGLYLGGSDKTYTFTAPTVDLNGANSAALVSWTKTVGGPGSFIIPANYTAGTAIAVDGQVNDAAHSSSWSGTSRATSGGNYTGSVDKFYTFTVPDGTIGDGVSDLTVHWSESTTGRTGTLTIPAAYAGAALNVDGVNSAVEDTWTGTSHATASGNYTGTDNQQYTLTVPSVTLDGANAQVTVNWTKVGGGAGSFDIPANYVAGTALDVEIPDNGVKIAFSSGNLVNTETFTVGTEQGPTVTFSNAGTGTLVNGQTFTIDARTGLTASFSSGTLVSAENFYIDTFTNVDTVQNGTWSGTSAASSAGHYLGATNKTFKFTASNSGTVGTDAITLQWTDTEGLSGNITIPSSYVAGANLDVHQGLKLNLSAGTVVAGNTFSIDVYSPTLQAGQDSGLAQVEQVVHSGFADSDTTAVTDDGAIFSLVYGGKRYSVDVDAGTTLSGLAAIINNDASNPGLQASVLNDGLGLSTSYHMVLTGQDTGAAYQLAQIQDSFTGGAFSSSDFTTTQKAQNSMVKVDGYPSDSSLYIQRSTNSISDVISGASLSLVSTGSATVSITSDVATIQNDIETFVTSINFVLDYIKAQTKYDQETGKAGIMIGNYSYNIVAMRINNILTNSVSGLTDGVDPYIHLAQIGIKTNPDNSGKWEIDTTLLSEALNSDLEGVQKLFTKDEVNNISGIYELLYQEMASINDSTDGPMNILLTNYDGIIENIDDKIEKEEKRIALLKERLTEQFARLEKMLSELNGQQTYLETLIDKLPGIYKSGS